MESYRMMGCLSPESTTDVCDQALPEHKTDRKIQVAYRVTWQRIRFANIVCLIFICSPTLTTVSVKGLPVFHHLSYSSDGSSLHRLCLKITAKNSKIPATDHHLLTLAGAISRAWLS